MLKNITLAYKLVLILKFKTVVQLCLSSLKTYLLYT